MKILALEFSSPQRSVAVVISISADAPAVAEIVETGVGALSPLAMVDRALREAKLEREEIDCLAIGLGPGSYTGIRSAIALAQGWQLSRGTRMVGISSADAIAAQAQTEGFTGGTSVVIDAQRGEIYLADYQIGPESWRITCPLRLATPEEAENRKRAGATLIGPDVTRWLPSAKLVFPRAESIGRMALAGVGIMAHESLEPIYLREAKFVKAPPPRVFSS